MSKYTKFSIARKLGRKDIPILKHETAIIDYKCKKFPVMVSPGQLINHKKAYKRYVSLIS